MILPLKICDKSYRNFGADICIQNAHRLSTWNLLDQNFWDAKHIVEIIASICQANEKKEQVIDRMVCLGFGNPISRTGNLRGAYLFRRPQMSMKL